MFDRNRDVPKETKSNKKKSSEESLKKHLTWLYKCEIQATIYMSDEPLRPDIL